jgi:hypothetical protein
VPFTDPYKPQDQIEQVRKVGRLAQIILDMRAEYERRPRMETLAQIVARIAEMETVRAEILAHMATPVAASDQPTPATPEIDGSEPPAEE